MKKSIKKYKRIVKELNKEDFLNILDFYLFNCPVRFENGKNVSAKGKTFEKRKITGVSLKKLLNKMRSVNNVKIIFDEKINKNKYKSLDGNYIILVENKSIGKTRSIFYMIRNMLAHGQFEYKSNILFGDNTHSKEIRAIVKLNICILYEWISLVENS